MERTETERRAGIEQTATDDVAQLRRAETLEVVMSFLEPIQKRVVTRLASRRVHQPVDPVFVIVLEPDGVIFGPVGQVDFDDRLGRSRAVVFGVEVERLSGKVVEPLHRRPVAVEIFENSKRTDRRGFVVRSDHERADGAVNIRIPPLDGGFPLFVLSQGVGCRVGHA